MKNKILSLVFLIPFAAFSQSDTLQIDCSLPYRKVALTSGIYIKPQSTCDTLVFVSKGHFGMMESELVKFREFNTIFEKYKELRKAQDADMTQIMASYDQIIQSKDEAFNTLYTEYYRLNGLLNKSVGQTDHALTLGEKTLLEIKSLNSDIRQENKALGESLSNLKNIAQREKWEAALKAGLWGGGISLVVGGVLGGIIGYAIAK